MGSKYTDIQVKGSVENVQNLVQHAFGANGFQVKWDGPTKGKAEKGSKGANLMLGALSQYYGVDFEIAPNPNGAILRLVKSNTGWAGGYLGARKVEKQFQQLGDTLAAWFQQQGVLLGRASD
ncbi:MAG: hypothetical protein E6K08_02670 [Methanobacteriota archaeon]|nr:MAG: hypothetical protein E6K08_02670 [Euryarchaeota archaeon]TLZ78958.1 MAG: hypothetical protein E6K11_07855 [Euryarchaeota archaeon]